MVLRIPVMTGREVREEGKMVDGVCSYIAFAEESGDSACFAEETHAGELSKLGHEGRVSRDCGCYV